MKRRQFTLSDQEVKRLRSETGLPIIDCKQALLKSGGHYVTAKKMLLDKHDEPLR